MPQERDVWIIVSAIATSIYSLSFLIALVYAKIQVRELRKARNAELYLRLHEFVVRDASNLQIGDCMKRISVQQYGYEEFRANCSEEEANAVVRICFHFCAMGHLLKEGYVDRRVLLEWVAPPAIQFRGYLDSLLADWRKNMPYMFEYFDYLRDEAKTYEANRGWDSAPGDMPMADSH